MSSSLLRDANNNRGRGLNDVTNRGVDYRLASEKAGLAALGLADEGMALAGNGGHLFAPGVLSEVEALKAWHDHLLKEGLRFRPLKSGDWGRGYPTLLAQLTTVGDVSEAEFERKLGLMAEVGREWIVVATTGEGAEEWVVASATLCVEEKFIHSASSRGRIEDVVVAEDWRGKSLGRILLETLAELARTLGTYKCSLECKDHLVGFYEKQGFTKDVGNNFMIRRFKD